jgi:hypothetical protein
MRTILKRREPRTVTETRCAKTTNLTRKETARAAFDQVEETLGLNEGDLPELREAMWRAFLDAVKRAHPGNHWDRATRISFFRRWQFEGKKLRPFVGVVEKKLSSSA